MRLGGLLLFEGLVCEGGRIGDSSWYLVPFEGIAYCGWFTASLVGEIGSEYYVGSEIYSVLEYDTFTYITLTYSSSKKYRYQEHTEHVSLPSKKEIAIHKLKHEPIFNNPKVYEYENYICYLEQLWQESSYYNELIDILAYGKCLKI